MIWDGSRRPKIGIHPVILSGSLYGWRYGKMAGLAAFRYRGLIQGR